MDNGSSRAERRAQTRRRSRAGLAIGIALVVVVAAAAVGVLVLAGGDDSSDDGSSTASRTVPDTNVTLAAGDVTADSAGPPVTIGPEIVDGVIDLIGEYLERATVRPLRTQRPVGDLSGVFDTAALARATGVDRGVLVDEGFPRVSGDLDVVAAPVGVTGLGDESGNLVLVTATIDLDISGKAEHDRGPVHIKRTGSFVVAPDATGTWKVASYTVFVERDGSGLQVPTTSTTTAGTG